LALRFLQFVWVPVAEIERLPPDVARLPGRALAVERFDRAPGGRRIHMEDFAQVFGLFPDAKYGQRSYACTRMAADRFYPRLMISLPRGPTFLMTRLLCRLGEPGASMALRSTSFDDSRKRHGYR
jgi:hypothetical protein